MLMFGMRSYAADLDWLSHQFVEVALGQEYREGYSKLKRWDKPLTLKVSTDVQLPQVIDELIDEQLRLLRLAAGVSFTRVPQDANLHLYFTTRKKMQAVWREYAAGEIPGDALCVSQISAKGTGEIVRAFILIPVDRASERGKLLSCIVEELTQSLGLINDSPDLYPSIFNDESNNQMMTSLDWLLLRTLYDAELEAGMNLDEVRRQVPQVLARLVDEGVRVEGEAHLKASLLYPLMEIN